MEHARAAGFIHREHEELFTEVGWLQVFAGQGVEARGYNPIADALPEGNKPASGRASRASIMLVRNSLGRGNTQASPARSRRSVQGREKSRSILTRA